jgi:foldase protein PrsA
MRRYALIIVAVLAIGFLFGCDQIEKLLKPKAEVKQTVKKTAVTQSNNLQEEEVTGTKLAKVNNKIITYEEFEQNIKNLKALSEEIKIETFDEKKGLLDEMVNQELLYQEAKSRGIDQRKEIKDLSEGYLRGLAVRQLMIDITENVTVDALEIETFYNQYKDQLSEPEQRRVREIVVSSDLRAKDIYMGLLNGEDFATVAKEKSIGDSAVNAGDAGLITYGQRGEEYKKYDEMAFALDKGELSSIFKGPKGFYIIKIEDVQVGKAKSLQDPELLEQIKSTVLSYKQQERLKDLLDKLKTNASLEINEELIK